MIRLEVSYTREALEVLEDVEYRIRRASSHAVASRFVRRLRAKCEAIGSVPLQGKDLSAFRAGVRAVGFQSRATILFQVFPDEIVILMIYYGGQQVRSIFKAYLARHFVSFSVATGTCAQ